MSGVFEKVPLIDPRHNWGDDTRARAYQYFYCPKCKARHKYGHRRSYIDCWRCWRSFSPDADSYRSEDDRITNLPLSQQDKAYKNIYNLTKAEYEAKQLKKLEPVKQPPRWWHKITQWLHL